MSNYLAPVVDQESAPFWDGLTRGELTLPSCMTCGRAHYYPRIVCPHCGSASLEWSVLSGRGTVYSVTRCHRLDHERRPFVQVIALVDLAEGPRMLVEVLDASELRIGDPVRLTPAGPSGPEGPDGPGALPFFTVVRPEGAQS